MSSDKTPDLVRRAAARLGSAQSHMSVTPAEPAPIPAPPPPAPSRTAAAFAAASAAPVDVLPEREAVRQELPRVEVPPRTPETRTVNVSPTSLAANSISLPSAGFVRTVEEFRVIKRQVLTNASRSAATGHNDYSRVIMVTSAKPGEGKTYTAINLALSIAHEKDLKVLLVDADVYRQSMLGYLGITADIGWIDLLADRKLTFSDVLLHTNIPNLSVLPAGHSHPEVPEICPAAGWARWSRRWPGVIPTASSSSTHCRA